MRNRFITVARMGLFIDSSEMFINLVDGGKRVICLFIERD
jgi:hypothetical protein